jgi:hypothetical protein
MKRNYCYFSDNNIAGSTDEEENQQKKRKIHKIMEELSKSPQRKPYRPINFPQFGDLDIRKCPGYNPETFLSKNFNIENLPYFKEITHIYDEHLYEVLNTEFGVINSYWNNRLYLRFYKISFSGDCQYDPNFATVECKCVKHYLKGFRHGLTFLGDTQMTSVLKLPTDVCLDVLTNIQDPSNSAYVRRYHLMLTLENRTIQKSVNCYCLYDFMLQGLKKIRHDRECKYPNPDKCGNQAFKEMKELELSKTLEHIHSMKKKPKKSAGEMCCDSFRYYEGYLDCWKSCVSSTLKISLSSNEHLYTNFVSFK